MAKARQTKKQSKKSVWAPREGDPLDVNFKTDIGAEVLEMAKQDEQEYAEVFITEYGIYNPMTREFTPWL